MHMNIEFSKDITLFFIVNIQARVRLSILMVAERLDNSTNDSDMKWQ
jgi:hypothetical protein